MHLGRINIGLHFTQGYRSVGERAVGVKDRIFRVLPSLVRQAVLTLAQVFDESVTIAVAIAVDPLKRGAYVGPQFPYGFEISGPFPIKAGKQHEQRRRIDRAIIHAKRNLSERGHFALAHLVENFPRLHVARCIQLARLRGREKIQNASSEARIESEHLDGGDDSIASEHSAEPWDPGV